MNKQLFDSEGGSPADIFSGACEREKWRENVLCTFFALSKLYVPCAACMPLHLPLFLSVLSSLIFSSLSRI